ncbi:hypothetical protein [Chryseobacterium sp. OSA05B]|uniref:hypothetical protein n=1 Tax=Chryseobacterium sp. OSA05B TaxID=2862650 RepID=UPI0034D18FF5
MFEYIETFYNTHRRHSALGNLTIKEYQNLMSNQSKNVAHRVYKFCLKNSCKFTLLINRKILRIIFVKNTNYL